MSVNSKMTAIANAIRAKTGGTAALTLDGMASAIAGIETGSGSSGGVEIPSFLSEINFGSFSHSSEKNSVSVEHGLSGKPTGFVVWRKAQSSNPGTEYLIAACGHSYKFYNTSTGGSFYGTTWLLMGATTVATGSFSANATSFNLYSSANNPYVQANTTYYWIAWR